MDSKEHLPDRISPNSDTWVAFYRKVDREVSDMAEYYVEKVEDRETTDIWDAVAEVVSQIGRNANA